MYERLAPDKYLKSISATSQVIANKYLPNALHSDKTGLDESRVC